jgi:ribonucleoside-triphosphate reductase
MRRIWALFVWTAVGVTILLTIGAGFPALRPAALFLFYSIPSNSVIPIPHEPGALYFSLLASPLALACAGALGTFVAAYLDRWLLGWLVRGRAGSALRRSRSWQVMTRMLLKMPFPTITVVAATGVPPVQAVRVLAASAGYPVRRYALAFALGRLPRFYLIALLGRELSLPGWLMGGLTIAFLAWPLYLVLRGAPAETSVDPLECEGAEPAVEEAIR